MSATPEQIAIIKRCWETGGFSRAAIRLTGLSVGKIAKIAQNHGFTRYKRQEQLWTDEEVKILEEFAHFSPTTISRKIKAATGRNRSLTSITLKRKNLKLLRNLDGYTLSDCAANLGCTRPRIKKWIEKGYLKAEQTDRASDAWFIHNRDLRRFILQHPTEIDLRTIDDQVWFLDMITLGKVGIR